MFSEMYSCFHSYVSGSGVDRGADFVVERIAKNCTKENQTLINGPYKTPLKVAMLWLTTSSLLVATAGNALLVPAVGYTFGTIMGIPFVGPLYRSLKSIVSSCVSNLPNWQRVQSVGAVSIFGAIQGRSMYAISSTLSSQAYIPLSLALSNLTLGGTLLITNIILQRHLKSEDNKKNEQITSDNKITAEIKALEENVLSFKNQIADLDHFIKVRKDLKELCLEYIAKFPAHIAKNKKPETKGLDPKNPIHARTLLRLKVIELEFLLNERKHFLLRYPEVYKCFSEHVYAERNKKNKPKNDQKTIEARALIPALAPATQSTLSNSILEEMD